MLERMRAWRERNGMWADLLTGAAYGVLLMGPLLLVLILLAQVIINV